MTAVWITYLEGYIKYRNKNTHTDIFKIVISVQYIEQVIAE